MSEDQENQPSSPDSLCPVALLLLPLTPPEADPGQWHWTRIAGVPFLLRNVLNIQRGGVKRLLIFSAIETEMAEELKRRLDDDKRVSISIEFCFDVQSIKEVAKASAKILVLDGATLYHQSEIRELLADTANVDEISDAFARFEEYVSGQVAEADQVPFFRSGKDNAKIGSAEDFYKEHHRLMQFGGLHNDSLVTRALSRSVSNLMTKAVIDTSLTPNQITGFSFLLGLAAVGFFMAGGYLFGIVGAVLLVVSTWIDGVDGEIARIKMMESAWGAKLDIFCDNVIHFLLFLSIGLGLTASTGVILYTLLGWIAAIGSIVSFILLSNSVINWKARATAGEGVDESQKIEDRLANRDFIWLILLLAVIGKMEFFIWLTAIGVNVFALYLLVARLRQR